MGKQSRRKKERIIKKQSNKNEHLNRRKFLKVAGGAAILSIPTFYILKNIFSDDKWSFLEQEYIGEDPEMVNINYIAENYVPLDKEGIYVVPEKKDIAESLKEYCKQAVKFLYENISGLDKQVIDWTIIKKDDDYSEGFNRKGFIGNSYYEIFKNLEFELSRGGFNIPILDTSTWKYDSWHLLILSGPGALCSPFSEIIPFTTLKRSIKNTERDGKMYIKEASKTDETISESLAHHLGIKIIKEMNIPNGSKHLQERNENYYQNPVYSYVPAAIKWIEMNGIQNAFDLYMESPKKFMDEIKKINS